ncbi:Pleckstrin y domain-containing family A member 3 [Amphibalanus amphitrite]|uniref:Pleckstrin y domain-containing family A member 3 n=1 Tax=Amphibalanus amphitrite TaxID=1232801 RepID=A0A6A4VJ84_AMPAM|nr:Pleckstrin y domain-containing family A member 3 [Amphibalanus amphitrite]
MEGILHKWTNYWNGWQPRWFILEDGVLSYYQSREDVSKGCKGSIKVSVSDISVHPTDATRLDLTIPYEQHYYLRAGSPAERQQWLIALGCAKQAAGPTRAGRDAPAEGATDSVRTKQSELRLYCDLLMQQAHQVKTAAGHADGPQLQELEEATSLLGPTCDTFIRTLDECMALVARASAGSPPPHAPDRSVPLHAVHQGKREKRMSTSSNDYSRTNSGGS